MARLIKVLTLLTLFFLSQCKLNDNEIKGSVSSSTEPPKILGLENSNSWASSVTWNWSCSETNCLYSKVTDSNSGTDPGETWGSANSFSVTSGAGRVYLHVVAKDRFGKKGEAIEVYADLDSFAPTAPHSLVINATSASPTSTPKLTWTTVSEPAGESGISSFVVQIYDAATNFEVGSPQALALGEELTSLNPPLSVGDSYYFKVKAIDLAGNESLWSSPSNSWLVENFWFKKIIEVGPDSVNQVKLTSDGGYVAVGKTSIGGGSRNAIITKYNSLGVELWTRIISGGSEQFYAVIETSDNHYLAVGDTITYSGGGFGGLMVKFDTSGNLVFSRLIQSQASFSIRGIMETSDNFLVLAGHSFNSGYWGVMAKFMLDGSHVWTRRSIPTTASSFNSATFNDIVEASDGDYVFAGRFEDWAPSPEEAFAAVFKLNPDGSLDWKRFVTDGGSPNSGVNYLSVRMEGANIVLGGQGDKYNFPGAWITKFDLSGTHLESTLLSDGSFPINSIKITGSGYLVAANNQLAFLNSDLLGVKWAKKLSVSSGWLSADIDSDGNIVAAGQIWSGGADNYDLVWAKLNSAGEIGACSDFTDSSLPIVMSSFSPSLSSSMGNWLTADSVVTVIAPTVLSAPISGAETLMCE